MDSEGAPEVISLRGGMPVPAKVVAELAAEVVVPEPVAADEEEVAEEEEEA